MGFFSWQCAKSKKPVMNRHAVKDTPWQFASRVVVVFNDGDQITGSYDGYGCVLGYDVITTQGGYDILEAGEHNWRMVIERYYAGETFDQLLPNGHDQGQGFFYSDEDLEKIFGSDTVEMR